MREAKARPRMISTWIDFVLWVDEHGDDDGKLEVALAQGCRSLSKWLLPIAGLHGDVNDRFRPNTWMARQAQSGSYAV
ncbi:MAG: hypothetical protein A4E49_03103 [Methanosaeta sp. PtaU1.Bin112]|nr:MAG: hypothetical protein A4E49_03103 [Methanosaeta sp. PtaU1.Bin112]